MITHTHAYNSTQQKIRYTQWSQHIAGPMSKKNKSPYTLHTLKYSLQRQIKWSIKTDRSIKNIKIPIK